MTSSGSSVSRARVHFRSTPRPLVRGRTRDTVALSRNNETGVGIWPIIRIRRCAELDLEDGRRRTGAKAHNEHQPRHGLTVCLLPLTGHVRERALAHCLSSSTLLFFRPPALSSGWGIMRSSASLPYTPRGAMCKNVCHLRWRQGSDRRAKQHNCSVGSVHVTDCSTHRAKHASTHMYVCTGIN